MPTTKTRIVQNEHPNSPFVGGEARRMYSTVETDGTASPYEHWGVFVEISIWTVTPCGRNTRCLDVATKKVSLNCCKRAKSLDPSPLQQNIFGVDAGSRPNQAWTVTHNGLVASAWVFNDEAFIAPVVRCALHSLLPEVSGLESRRL